MLTLSLFPAISCSLNMLIACCRLLPGWAWGTKGAGLFCLQDGKFTSYTTTNGLPSNLAWSLFVDRNDTLWVGTSSQGVYQFRDDRFVSMFDENRISHRVNAIQEDRQGRIWFGHWGGLTCYADGQLTRLVMPWFSDDYEVVAIASDRQARLWLGTKGAGLFWLHDGKFTSYTTTNELPSNLAW